MEDIRALRARRYREQALDEEQEPGRRDASTADAQGPRFNFKSGTVIPAKGAQDEPDAAEDALSKYTTLQDTSDEEQELVNDAGTVGERKRQPYAHGTASREDLRPRTAAEDEKEADDSKSPYPQLRPQREHVRPKREPRAPTPTPTPTQDTPAPRPAAPAEEERTCRICFSPQTPEDRLISPCKCKGSAKWIHETCLNQWRMTSANRRSFYQCDQCLYKYSFYRTDVANWLAAPSTALFFSALAFFLAMFFGGFFVKFGLWLYPPESMLYHSSSWLSGWFYTPFDAGADLLSATSALIPAVPRKFSDIFRVDVWHFAEGLISIGILGIVTFMGSGGLFSMRLFHPRRRRGEEGRGLGLGEIAFIAVLFVGCAKVFLSLWRFTREQIRRRLHGASERIREVHD